MLSIKTVVVWEVLLCLPAGICSVNRLYGVSCTAETLISWISSFAWPDDDSLVSKHVAVSIILCNKFAVFETSILYELYKHIGMTTCTVSILNVAVISIYKVSEFCIPV
jgi:hypothetical protein